MHQIKFYPVGNGDTCQIILINERRILLDYRHLKSSEDLASGLFNLKQALTDELKKAQRNYFDVVAFTHADDDHIANSSEFFELMHSPAYQGNGRIKIRELWVPAAMILETTTREGQGAEFVTWRREARHRLREGKGIRIFSKPEMLKQWLEGEGLTLESRAHLIEDAGTVVPTFSLAVDEVEFFCHSPFVKHVDEGDDLRNDASLIFQVRFETGGTRFDYLAIGDSTHEVLSDIVEITKWHGNDDRLNWNLYNIPHHCSYLALGPEKGDLETIPVPLVIEWLMHGQPDAYMISSSDPIGNSTEDYERTQPPHVQAKKAYLRYFQEVGGRKFLVTMEHPNTRRPSPIVFEITPLGGKLVTAPAAAAAAAIVSAPAPRAG